MEPLTARSGLELPPTKAVDAGPAGDEGEGTVDKLAKEMSQAWRRGERLSAADLLASHPDLRGQKEVVLRLICEELCLRREANLGIDPANWADHFPEWRHEIEALFECQRLLDEDSAAAKQAGELGGFRDFHILAELGQGGQGTVYLATQPLLADRPVVLKITPCRGREHLSLARLQHTNIVPLFWVQDHPEDDQRLLCMPYFGSVTVAHILKAVEKIPPGQRTAQHIFDVLDKSPNPHLSRTPPRSPMRQLFARASFAQVTAWMGACLADALHYAHERDLIHFDIKPSNVLLTNEGQPMLLDFHLARHPIQAGSSGPQGIGGTPLYMAPEQEAALQAVFKGKPVPQLVDTRADIFALGLMMYQALGGRFPLPKENPPRLDECNPQVTPGLADIIHKCLAREPGQRYARADQLATDLRRHLADLPLRGVPNRSWHERWHKWRRRKPHALHFWLMLAVMTVLTVSAVALFWVNHRSRLHQQELVQQEAEKALAKSNELIQDHHYDLALATLDNAMVWIPSSAAGEKLTQAFAAQRGVIAAKKAAQLLHGGVNVLRVAVVADTLSVEQRGELVKKCQQLWQQRAFLLPLVLTEANTRQDLIDLAVIWSDLREEVDSGPATQRAILEVLAETANTCGPSYLLEQARLRRAQALGLSAEGKTGARRVANKTIVGVWEQVAWARTLLQKNHHAAQAQYGAGLVGLLAEPSPWGVLGFADQAGDQNRWRLARHHLRQALAREPNHYWANFYDGVGAYRLRQTSDALLAFHVCVALTPRDAATYYNRGLAHAQAEHWQEALEDYTQALRLDGHFGLAALNRALIFARWHNYAAALADLELARDKGADPRLVQVNVATVQKMQGRRQDKR